MFRRFMVAVVMLALGIAPAPAQSPARAQGAGLLRDYVGLINQSFHPEIVTFMRKMKDDFEQRGQRDAAKSIDSYLKGGSGTGFVYLAEDGANYIITNYHVISQAYSLSISFEKLDGTKTTYTGLSIVAADEGMDIALLAFEDGARPFARGLPFLERPVEEGEIVYSAGFPGLGATTIWQFGQGMISNARVYLPANDEGGDGDMMGPYIQHTAQVDPGNSGGPLLVSDSGAFTGYAIVGINTLSARNRQAANYSIPIGRAQDFLGAALDSRPAAEGPRLEERLAAFIRDLNSPQPVYRDIAKYLSNHCVAENAEYAVMEMFRNAAPGVIGDIIRVFNYSPVEGMNLAVAWTIENSLRKRGSAGIDTESIEPGDSGQYLVRFRGGKAVTSSEWINEYGIWRIRRFGEFASGNSDFIREREGWYHQTSKLRTSHFYSFTAGYSYILGRGPALGMESNFHLWVFSFGAQIYAGSSLFQWEGTSGLYFPVRVKDKIAITPFLGTALGLVWKDTREEKGLLSLNDGSTIMDLALSARGGLRLTTSLVPGLFLQAAYQYSKALPSALAEKNSHLFSLGVGYGF